MILERLQVLLEGDTSGLAGAFRKLAAGVTAGAVFHKIIEESTEAQFAMAQLEAAVASTGGAAGKSVEELDGLSNALERETTFSDEAIKSAESMLLTFTKIAGPTFDRATRTVLDLATAMGGDLKGASVQLGKALNDPITGITALTRVGVTFSDQQKAVIENLVETNRLADAQAIILSELEREFGGSAAAARDTLGGALQALGNQWGNLFEVSRENSGGIIDAVNAIGDALPFVRDRMSEFFQIVQGLGAQAAVGVEHFRIAWLRLKKVFAFGEADAELGRQIESATQMLGFMRTAADETWTEVVTGGTQAAAVIRAVTAETSALVFESVKVRQVWNDPGLYDMGKSLEAAITRATRATNQMLGQAEQLNDTLGDGIVETAEAGLGAILGFTTGASDAFGQFVDFAIAELQRLIAKLVVVSALKAIFSGATGGIGGAVLGALEGRASGGPVTGGRPYMVGERGPELFVPSSSGSIVPNGGGAAFALPPLPRPMSPSEAASQAWMIQTVEKVIANLGRR